MAITVRCKMCKHAMKFSAEKAGKRAKCPKCDAIVLVQAEAEPAKEPEPAPAAPASNLDLDTTGYEVFTDPELQELAKQREADGEAKKKKEKKILPKVARRVKAIPDAESWQRVRIGLIFIFVGACIWFFTHILQGSYVLIGSTELAEYAKLIATNLEVRDGEAPQRLPAREDAWDMDWLGIYLGMIAGSDFTNYAYTCLVIASVCYFFQAISWAIGYGIAMVVPRRFGAFGQLITSGILGLFNFLFVFIFKLLPVLGILSYVLIPYVTPEIVMTEYNMERTMPVHLMYAAAPFWESLLNVILLFVLYLQPTFGCIFLWTIGKAARDENLEASAKGLTQMSLGTFFILLTFHLLSLCGGSGVLVIVLRVFYAVWWVFLLLFILQYAMLILKVRTILYDKINPRNELE
ncbi:MAG: hypothetical protein EXR98_06375 [Gemmataceae bacterium]|nr:hypothetical protein [Gemmataceae bacterium]